MGDEDVKGISLRRSMFAAGNGPAEKGGQYCRRKN